MGTEDMPVLPLRCKVTMLHQNVANDAVRELKNKTTWGHVGLSLEARDMQMHCCVHERQAMSLSDELRKARRQSCCDL